MKKKVLIIGITGQDGILLSAKLLAEGYSVDGLPRNFPLESYVEIENVISQKYEEIYYLAAHQASSEESSLEAVTSFRVNVQSLCHVMEAIKQISPTTKLFSAASAHMYGRSDGQLLDEESIMKPICLYGHTKFLAHKTLGFYREQYKLHFVSGILFNHESQYKKKNFLSRKIILGAQRIARSGVGELVLGDLSQKVDWGYAPDYVEAFPIVLRHPYPSDFVISSGELHSVEEFVEIVFNFYQLDAKKFIRVDESLLKGPKRGTLLGNNSKIIRETSWRPHSPFKDWIEKLCSETKEDSVL